MVTGLSQSLLNMQKLFACCDRILEELPTEQMAKQGLYAKLYNSRFVVA